MTLHTLISRHDFSERQWRVLAAVVRLCEECGVARVRVPRLELVGELIRMERREVGRVLGELKRAAVLLVTELPGEQWEISVQADASAWRVAPRQDVTLERAALDTIRGYNRQGTPRLVPEEPSLAEVRSELAAKGELRAPVVPDRVVDYHPGGRLPPSHGMEPFGNHLRHSHTATKDHSPTIHGGGNGFLPVDGHGLDGSKAMGEVVDVGTLETVTLEEIEAELVRVSQGQFSPQHLLAWRGFIRQRPELVRGIIQDLSRRRDKTPVPRRAAWLWNALKGECIRRGIRLEGM